MGVFFPCCSNTIRANEIGGGRFWPMKLAAVRDKIGTYAGLAAVRDKIGTYAGLAAVRDKIGTYAGLERFERERACNPHRVQEGLECPVVRVAIKIFALRLPRPA